MEKKLYWELSDNADLSVTTDNLEQAMILIRETQNDIQECDKEIAVYSLIPVYMTDEEYEQLAEQD